METDYDRVLGEIHAIKLSLHDLESKVTDLEKDIRQEMEFKLKQTEWEHTNYDRRISLTERVLFGAVGIILVAVLGALLTKVIV
jgi:hypothetical protein